MTDPLQPASSPPPHLLRVSSERQTERESVEANVADGNTKLRKHIGFSSFFVKTRTSSIYYIRHQNKCDYVTEVESLLFSNQSNHALIFDQFPIH